jgi:hypothetical protein
MKHVVTTGFEQASSFDGFVFWNNFTHVSRDTDFILHAPQADATIFFLGGGEQCPIRTMVDSTTPRGDIHGFSRTLFPGSGLEKGYTPHLRVKRLVNISPLTFC